jgi:phosphohistidine phosphatase
MKLFLVRHAEAEAAAEDSIRPLSVRGRGDARRLAAFLGGNGALAGATTVWHSPLVRARETAAILCEILGPGLQRVESPGLEPGDDPAATAGRLARLMDGLVIVGHEPHLSTLASLLVSGRSDPSFFFLEKAGVIALESVGPLSRQTSRSRSWCVCWQIALELLTPAQPH